MLRIGMHRLRWCCEIWEFLLWHAQRIEADCSFAYALQLLSTSLLGTKALGAEYFESSVRLRLSFGLQGAKMRRMRDTRYDEAYVST